MKNPRTLNVKPDLGNVELELQATAGGPLRKFTVSTVLVRARVRVCRRHYCGPGVFFGCELVELGVLHARIYVCLCVVCASTCVCSSSRFRAVESRAFRWVN